MKPIKGDKAVPSSKTASPRLGSTQYALDIAESLREDYRLHRYQNCHVAATTIERLVEALKQSMTALDDWLNTYADDQCDPKRVAEARKRISEHGTIGYIAHVQKNNRYALTTKR